jgi:hypothetical protein
MTAMVRPLLIAALVVTTAACGKSKDKDKAAPAQDKVDMSDATCQDADSCVADCEQNKVTACALASTVYGLGYKIAPDPDRAATYRARYLRLRELGCKQEHRPLCDDSAPKGIQPDWQELQTKCRAGDLNSCLRCKVDRYGDDCQRIPVPGH